MNDRELAEKVAEKLGWIVVSGDSPFGKCWHDENGDHQFEDDFFSWHTFGLMVEDAERRGWLMVCSGGSIYFDACDSVGCYRETDHYLFKEHGHIKACALAYVEITDE